MSPRFSCLCTCGKWRFAQERRIGVAYYCEAWKAKRNWKAQWEIVPRLQSPRQDIALTAGETDSAGLSSYHAQIGHEFEDCLTTHVRTRNIAQMQKWIGLWEERQQEGEDSADE